MIESLFLFLVILNLLQTPGKILYSILFCTLSIIKRTVYFIKLSLLLEILTNVQILLLKIKICEIAPIKKGKKYCAFNVKFNLILIFTVGKKINKIMSIIIISN